MKKNICLLCSIALFQGLVFSYPISVLFKISRGLSINEIFILESIFIIFMLISEIPWGFFADRHGYKKTLVISYFIYLFSKLILYFSHSFLLFILQNILEALAVSGISGCDSAFIYSSSQKDNTSKAFSLYSGSRMAGFFIASFTSVFLIRFSYDFLVFITIIPYTLSFLLSFFLFDTDKKDESSSIKTSFKNVLQNKSIFLFIIPMALISQATCSICVLLNQPLYIECGIDARYFGIINAGAQLLCLVSARAYKLSQKAGEGRLIAVLFGFIASASFILFITKSVWISILLVCCEEAAYMICEPVSQSIQNRMIKTSDRATLLSTNSMLSDLLGAAANIFIGFAAQYSIRSGILLCGLLSTLALIVVVIYFKKYHVYEKDVPLNGIEV